MTLPSGWCGVVVEGRVERSALRDDCTLLTMDLLGKMKAHAGDGGATGACTPPTAQTPASTPVTLLLSLVGLTVSISSASAHCEVWG